MGGNNSRKGGSRQTQQQTQTSAPPVWAAPLFRQGARDALDLYQSGKGSNIYQGPRVASLSQETQNAVHGLQNAADAFSNPVLTGLAGNQTAASKNLADMASGTYLRQGNPYYRERLNHEISDMASRVNSQMSGAGRYGSAANRDVLAKNTSGMLLRGLESDYSHAMQNMLSANDRIDSANQNQLNAAGNYFRNQAGAHGAALAGGQVRDQYTKSKLDADWQKWAEEENRDWNRINNLQKAAQGFAGHYGTQSSTGRIRSGKTASPWQQADNIGRAVGGLLQKSDIRAKENIILAGERCGFPVYDFNYTGQPERWRGVMAQDVIKISPDAVYIDPGDGLYCVDYAQLGFAMERLD